MDRRPSSPTLILLLALLIACGLHLHGIDRESLWRDEVDSIRFAAATWEALSQGDSLPGVAQELGRTLIQPGQNGPLYFGALELWLRIAGRSELALRLPSTLAALLSVALCYPLGAHLVDKKTGLIASALMALNPYLAWYAGEGKMYTLITALTLFSTYLLLRAAAGGRRTLWIGYVVAASALFYCHILTPLLLPVHLALLVLLYPRVLRTPAVWLAGAALTLPYLPLLLWQWPLVTRPAETGFAFVPLPQMVARLGEVFSRGIVGWPALLPLALLSAAILAGVALARPRAVWALVWWAAAPVLALYLISTRRPLFTERYLIWTLPAWTLAAGAGLAAVARRGRAARWLALVWTAALLLVGLLGIGRQWATPVRADFRGAAAFVTEHYQSGELILFQIPYLQATFDYYASDLDYPAAEGPFTNRGGPPAEVDDYPAPGDGRTSRASGWSSLRHPCGTRET